MNTLEKILEEIESDKNYSLPIDAPANDKYQEGYVAGMTYAQEIIKEHMNEVASLQNKVVVDILNGLADWWYAEAPIDEGEEKSETLKVLEQVQGFVETFLNEDVDEKSGWIPVSERLPEENDSAFAKFKGTPTWNDCMFEKVSKKVNVTIEFKDGTRKTNTSYTIDGEWKIEKNGFVEKKVVAWQPLPEAYREEPQS